MQCYDGCHSKNTDSRGFQRSELMYFIKCFSYTLENKGEHNR